MYTRILRKSRNLIQLLIINESNSLPIRHSLGINSDIVEDAVIEGFVLLAIPLLVVVVLLPPPVPVVLSIEELTGLVDVEIEFLCCERRVSCLV